MTSTAEKSNPTVPDGAELVRRATELKPLLADHARASEATMAIPEESLEAVREAGFLRLNTPRRYGGYEVSLRTSYEVMSVLAEADASVAWVVGVYSGGGAGAAARPERVQAEVFGGGPDVQICGSGMAASDVEKVGDGYVVSGRWPSASGSGHARWATVEILLPVGEDGQRAKASVMIPIGDLQLEKTWDATGMRGTESETLVAERVFVPDYRVAPAEVLESEDFERHPPAHAGELRYRSARGPKMALGVTVVPVGVARGALDYALEQGRVRALSGTIYKPAGQSTSFQNELSDAAMLIDTARLHLFRAADAIDGYTERREEMDLITRARCRADAGWVMKSVTEAIERIMTAVGSGAFSEKNPLERRWRDLSTGARHGAANYIISREIYGRALFGVDPNISRLPV
jgi:alkylation response protein AidB-like acyl-CoA dehydrogenase